MDNFGIVDLRSNGIDIEILGLTVAEIKIPSDYVPYTFAPILGMHRLITGDQLANGMIVVIADRAVRANPNVLSPEHPDRKKGFVPSEYDRARVEESARWALVTDLRQDGALISFTAIYSDGTMRDRRYDKSYKWAALEKNEVRFVCEICGEAHSSTEEDAAKIPSEDAVLDIFGRAVKNMGVLLGINVDFSVEDVVTESEATLLGILNGDSDDTDTDQ